MTVDAGVGVGGLGGVWLDCAAVGEWGEAVAWCGVGEGVVRARVMQLARRLGIDHVGLDESYVAGVVLPVFVEGRPPVPELWERLCGGEFDWVDSVYLAAVGRVDLAVALLAGHGVGADALWLSSVAQGVLQAGGHRVEVMDPVAVFGQLYQALSDQSVLDLWHHTLLNPVLSETVPGPDPAPFPAADGSALSVHTDGTHAMSVPPAPEDPAVYAGAWTSAAGNGGGFPAGPGHATGPEAAGAMDVTAYGPGGHGGPANTTAQTQAPDTAGTAALAPPPHKRKRVNPTDALPTAVHPPRPAHGLTRHTDEIVLAGIRDTLQDMGIDPTAWRIHTSPASRTSWLVHGSSSLGLDGALPLGTLNFIRANMGTVAPALVGEQAADLVPETPVPAFLNEPDQQIIATLLHHPDRIYTDILNLYNLSFTSMSRRMEALGQQLGVDKKPSEVVAYVRDPENRERVLHLAGLTEATIAQHLLPVGQPEPLTERDRQVIATLLHHPDRTHLAIAALYHIPQSTVQAWVRNLGCRLGGKRTAAKVVQYVRATENREKMLGLAGLTETTITSHLLLVRD
ncbi:hypothetical protein [Streptomyces sp. NPDC051014]|uniref:hypothetical protein n=1 Tax=Streptomyces sp. NPDC051014 TaxID=3155751 RepID=UPI0033F2A2E0